MGVLTLVVALGGIVRLLLHRGVVYSPADETVYARYSCYLTERGVLHGYPELVATYLATPADHLYPSPARWGFLLPSAAASELLGCGPAAVAWVSTLSGIGMLALVAVLGHRLLPGPVALVATVFVASSPLQLIVGRRALGDELLAVVVVLAWAVTWRYARRGTVRSWGAALAVLVLGFGVKEIFFLALPAVLVPLLWERWQHRPRRRQLVADAALVVLAPVVNAVVVAVLARSWSADLEMLRAIQSTTDAVYPAAYMAGPLHRLPVDLILVAPALTLLAIVSTGMLPDRGGRTVRIVAVSALAAVVPYAVVDAQDVRLVVAGETFLAILAAWGLVTACGRRPVLCVASVAAVVCWNGWMVWTLSVQGAIYDPVTAELVRILGMVP